MPTRQPGSPAARNGGSSRRSIRARPCRDRRAKPAGSGPARARGAEPSAETTPFPPALQALLGRRSFPAPGRQVGLLAWGSGRLVPFGSPTGATGRPTTSRAGEPASVSMTECTTPGSRPALRVGSLLWLREDARATGRCLRERGRLRSRPGELIPRGVERGPVATAPSLWSTAPSRCESVDASRSSLSRGPCWLLRFADGPTPCEVRSGGPVLLSPHRARPRLSGREQVKPTGVLPALPAPKYTPVPIDWTTGGSGRLRCSTGNIRHLGVS